LKKAKKNGNDIVPKWKNKKKKLQTKTKKKQVRKGAIKALFFFFFFRGVKEDFDTLKTSGPE
jgi:hypothetical protein